MAKTKRCSILLGAPLVLAFSPGATALEPLSAPALLEACQTYQRDSNAPEALTCRGFILGYLSGSADIVAEEERPEGFAARALRTRGMRLPDDTQQRLRSRYCLPKGETLEDLVARLAGASRQFTVDAQADVAMRHLFEKHYRCDALTRN